MYKYSIILIMLVVCSCSSIKYRYHTFRSGDSLWSLSKLYDVTIESLRRSNKTQLKEGLKIYIPYESNPDFDNPYYYLDKVPVTRELSENTKLKLIWPVKGPISSFFGAKRKINRYKFRRHAGIDIVALRGTPVKAAESGLVHFVGQNVPGYGKVVIIKHNNSFSTLYAHLMSTNVKKGSYVRKGHFIGRVGRTGRTTGSHLHFEVRNIRRAVNPLNYLPYERYYASLGNKFKTFK